MAHREVALPILAVEDVPEPGVAYRLDSSGVLLESCEGWLGDMEPSDQDARIMRKLRAMAKATEQESTGE